MDTASRVKPLRDSDPARLGRYRLKGRLGAGGMGVVYLAEDPWDQLVAVKLLHTIHTGDAEFIGRFRSEISRAKQVPAFCTAEVLDADLDRDQPYLVTEYVDGPSLAEVVGAGGPLSGSMLQSVATGVATALVGIHGAGVIHRDLKPENVLLPPGSPKVIDFGIARAFEATSRHTRTDQFVGTVAYMAPERFDNEPGAELTGAADVFSWGCVIGFAAAGRTPFHGDTPTVTAARILTQPPYLDRLDGTLRDVVQHSLAKDPADRPTAREVLDALVSGVSTSPPPVEQTRPASPAAPPVAEGTGVRAHRRRRNRLVPALVTVGLAAAAVTGGVVLWKSSSTPDAVAPGPVTTPVSTRSAPVPTGSTLAALPRSVLSRQEWLRRWIGPEFSPCELEGGVLRASVTIPDDFPCGRGTSAQNIGDHSLTIESAGLSGDPCVAYWFHFTEGAGGHLMRICRDEIIVQADREDDNRLYGRIVVPDPPEAGERFTIRVDVRGHQVTVARDKTVIGTVWLPADTEATGRSVVGMTGRDRGAGPYELVIYDANLVLAS